MNIRSPNAQTAGASGQIECRHASNPASWGKTDGANAGEEGGQTYVLRADGLLAGLAKLLNSLRVVSQIPLAADENDGQALAEMHNL
jgi:hypothetical protein